MPGSYLKYATTTSFQIHHSLILIMSNDEFQTIATRRPWSVLMCAPRTCMNGLGKSRTLSEGSRSAILNSRSEPFEHEAGGQTTQIGHSVEEFYLLLATCFHTGFLLDLFFDLEEGDDIFIRNVGWLSADYTALCARR
jgi:hypothetical protein